MKTIILFLISMMMVLAEIPKGWTDDYDSALGKAAKEKKFVLLEFTGSDWCAPCMMMRKNVFTKEEFVKKASENFVLVELDFPKKDKELAEKNKPLAEKYKITGYPTVVLLDEAGKEVTRFFASEHQTVKAFLEHLDVTLERRTMD